MKRCGGGPGRWLPTVWLQIFSQRRTVKPPTQKEADILQIVEKRGGV